MTVTEIVSLLALRPIAEGAGVTPEPERLLGDRFAEQNDRLIRALTRANERAWQSLEIALAGGSVGDNQELRRHLEAFLEGTPPSAGITADPFFRRRCLDQVRAAHQANLLLGKLNVGRLAPEAARIATVTDGRRLRQADWQAMASLTAILDGAGHAELAEFLRVQPPTQTPFLAAAARSFFRRAVLGDDHLTRAFDFARWEQLAKPQQTGFESLERAFAEHGRVLSEVLAVTGGLRADLLDLDAETRRQGGEHQELYGKVLHLLERHRLPRRELRPGNSPILDGEDDRQEVRQVVLAYRDLAESQRRKMPALLNGLALLQTAAGELPAAQKDFETLAQGIRSDAFARAAVLFNAYCAALRRRCWDDALGLLRQAAALDPQRFAPFPLDRCTPDRILAADDSRVVFLCQHQYLNAVVVATAFHGDYTLEAVERMFADAQVLRQVDHPAVTRVHEFGYADPAARTHPFLVVEHWDGVAVEEHVKTHGRISVGDALELARQLAEGLQALHAAGRVHGDVSPSKVFVRKTVNEPRATKKATANLLARWEVKLAAVDLSPRETNGKRQPGEDVTGWARTVSFALFHTVEPQKKDLQNLPIVLAGLLGSCLGESSEPPPADMGEVLRRLPSAEAGTTAAPRQPAVTADPATVATWEGVRQQDTAEAYERFLDQSPNSPFAGEARGRAESLLRRSLLRCPDDPGLRYRYLTRRTAWGEGRDRRRAWLGLWLSATVMGTLFWAIVTPLAGLAAKFALPYWDGWLWLGLAAFPPAGLVTGLVWSLLFGIGDSLKYVPLGPLPWVDYFSNPDRAREKNPGL